MKTIQLNKRDVPSTLIGGYSGNKFEAIVTEEVTIPSDAGQWGGGSRDSYSYIELSTGRSIPTPVGSSAKLPPGLVLRVHSIFCGKDCGLKFYVNPVNAALMLPDSGGFELTEAQKMVLSATASLKSSYNGKDRYENSKPHGAMSKGERATRQAQVEALFLEKGNVKLKSGKLASDRIDELKAWTNFFPSREEWEEAKNALITRKLLNKAGALTVEGRNAL